MSIISNTLTDNASFGSRLRITVQLFKSTSKKKDDEYVIWSDDI